MEGEVKKFGRRNKFNVAPKEQRTHNGKVYASKAEAEYAAVIGLSLRAGAILCVQEQPCVTLGLPELKYIPDFLITNNDGSKFYVDVKGMETPIFRKNKKLWAKYGPGQLHIVKKSGKRFKPVEIITPQAKKEGA